MADMPFSVNSKYIAKNGAEILLSVRGTTIESFTKNLEAANEVFPHAGFGQAPATPPVIVSGDIDAGGQDEVTQRRQTLAARTQQAENAAVKRQVARDDSAPKCAHHNRPMIRSKREGVAWYCPAKDPDTGTFCDVYVEAA